MNPLEIGAASVVVMLLLIYLGFHIAYVLALTSFVGVWAVRGNFDAAVQMLVQTATHGIADYVFAVVPLFVLMGVLVSLSELSRDSYTVANQLLRRLPARLGVATVAANAVFAAITGISIASAAVFSRIAVPEMLRFGYDKRLAVGVVSGSSVLGMLLPPSVLLIIYALVAEQSVGAMFIAAIVPGILLAVMFAVSLIVCALVYPRAIFKGGVELNTTTSEPLLRTGELLIKIAPIALLVVAVMGGIYGGVFTPTEAGAVGAALALLIALVKRKMSWRILWDALVSTGYVTASVLFVVIAATMYSRMLGISGLPTYLGEIVAGISSSYLVIVLSFVLIALILGMIIDAASNILITIPLFLPLLAPFDVNLVWFGIVAVIAIEIGLLTPPFGLSCFVVSGALQGTGVTLRDVFIGSMPFAAIMLLLVVLLIAFPQIALIFL